MFSFLGLSGLNVQADTITNLREVSVPPSINYGQSFTSVATQTTFFDDYPFAITGASADSVTSSINFGDFLGIGSLQSRLYTGSADYTGAIPSGQLLEEGWGNTVNISRSVSATTVILNPVTLAAGTYTMQIMGTVTGAYGGSYAGVLNLAPVPAVPEVSEWLMMLSGTGMGLAGFIATRGKNQNISMISA